MQARFTMQPNLILFVFASLGIYFLFNIFISPPKLFQNLKINSDPTKIKLLLNGFIFGSVILQINLNFPANNFKDFWGFHHTARRALESLPENSLLLLNGKCFGVLCCVLECCF